MPMARLELRKIGMIKLNNKRLLLKIFNLLFFLTALSGYFGIAKASPQSILDLKNNDWQVIADSGWPGASSGYVNKPKEDSRLREFVYRLKATKLWPWPEVDFFVSLAETADFSKFKGIQLDIQGEPGKEIYCYFFVQDQNLGNSKPLMSRFLLTGEKQKIYLALSGFKIASDWQARNPGYSQSMEWAKVKSFGLHAKGRDNERGRIVLFEAKLLENELSDPFDLTRIRSSPPKYYLLGPEAGFPKQAQAKISIGSPLKNKHEVAPYLYGANWGVWLNLPDEKKVSLLKPKVLRSGGPFMDRYNWRNGKYTFPGNDQVITMASLDEFIAYCRRIGAEPLIQINALGYAPFTQPMDEKDAVGWLRYLNQEKGYNVKFFEIGNEPFIWHKVHFDARKTPCSIEEYFALFKKISVALKKAQKEINPDLKIKIFAPAFCLEDMQLSAIAGFLRKCYAFQNNQAENPQKIRILDVLSFHFFPSFVNPATGKHQKDATLILGSTQSWWSAFYSNKYDYSLPFGYVAKILPRLKKLIKDNYARTELALTEFNIESQSMVGYDPLIKALYLGDLYGIMAKYGLDYFMQFCLNSSDQNIALIDDLDNLTAQYYPFGLYSEHFHGLLLDAKTNLPEKLNVYACNNKNGTTIMVINKDRQPYFSGIRVKSENNETFFSHTFPALSLSCIIINEHQKRNLAQCWEYGQQQIN